MNFWDKITGNDMTRAFKNQEERVKKLPMPYQVAWEKFKEAIWQHSDFTGRNLTAFMDEALAFLEEAAVDGLDVNDSLGGDIEAFCTDLIGEEGSKSYRNIWRKQLNRNVARRLGK